MIPLSFAETGEKNSIKRICGNPEVKRHLESMGFVAGEHVAVVSTLGGNVIVSVKGSRVAISREMAQKIYI